MKKFINKNVINKVLCFLNRISCYIDLVLWFLICDYIAKNQFNDGIFSILCYLPLILQIVVIVKTEYKLFKSNTSMDFILDNGRVMAFTGAQGRGKSSLCCCLASKRRFEKVYSNTPLLLRQKYTAILESDILNLDSKIPDYSLLVMDEATIFFHNLKNNVTKNFSESLYSQEVLTQCIRHFFDGNMFYIGTNINRLPSVLKENIGITNLALGQETKQVSYITGTFLNMIAKLFKIDFKSGVRYWYVQQFEKIPDDNYVFDLSNIDRDNVDLDKFANSLTICAFNNNLVFDYNDRFLRGLYEELPDHIDNYYESLNMDIDLLTSMGYGDLVDYFKRKKLYLNVHKNKEKKSEDNVNFDNGG